MADVKPVSDLLKEFVESGSYPDEPTDLKDILAQTEEFSEEGEDDEEDEEDDDEDEEDE